MNVRRIVANISAAEPSLARAFYQDVLGLDLLMDHGWIQTYGRDTAMSVQVSVASEGGSGTPVPDLSIEVDESMKRIAAWWPRALPSNTALPTSRGACAVSMCVIRSGDW